MPYWSLTGRVAFRSAGAQERLCHPVLKESAGADGRHPLIGMNAVEESMESVPYDEWGYRTHDLSLV
jgi:hypothetical protein